MSAAGGPHAGRELFVWYRVAADRAGRLRDDVETMQRALETSCPGLRARLLVRADEAGPQTWMETYAMAGASGVGEALQARIEQAALTLRPALDGDRHVESFDAVERA